MSEDKLAKTPEGDDEETGEKPGKMRWVIGWIVVPGSLLGALFLSGMHVGANHPDMWLSRLITWFGS